MSQCPNQVVVGEASLLGEGELVTQGGEQGYRISRELVGPWRSGFACRAGKLERLREKRNREDCCREVGVECNGVRSSEDVFNKPEKVSKI
jgi:hypothetical protein